MARISSRDLDYCENRLLAPAVAASEAYARLVVMDGQADLAARLMEAQQAFTDACREIRRELSDRYMTLPPS